LERRSSKVISAALLDQVVPLCKATQADAIFVYAGALDGAKLVLPDDLGCRVVYVTRTRTEEQAQKERGTTYVRVPRVPLTRMGQIKLALFIGLSRGLVHRGDVIVCLCGMSGSHSIDTMVVSEVGRELEILASGEDPTELLSHARPEVIERVVDIATALGREGREGKPIGTAFVIGDSENVLQNSRQMILNPFHGYSEQERNVLDPALEETIKELAMLDGAFVIRGDGIVESCGTLLEVGSHDEHELPRGLGARHHAAAGITAITRAISVTVSQSTGAVTVFHSGHIITEITETRGP
jgi:diadenylate cyclase